MKQLKLVFASLMLLTALGSFSQNKKFQSTNQNDGSRAHCVPEYILGCQYGDGLTDFVLEQIENYESGCGNLNGTGWSQYPDLGPAEMAPGFTYTVTMNAGYKDNNVSIWIDFNDDDILSEDELVLLNYPLPPAGTFEQVDIHIPEDAPAGLHMMRVRTQYDEDCLDPCAEYEYGEAEDYMVNITTEAVGEIVFQDDFDAYNAGELLACQNSDDWTTWSNNPCGADDAMVVDTYSASESNSVQIINDIDLVKPFDALDYTNGHYVLSFNMMIPAGKDAYWNVLSEWVDVQTWALEVFFDNGNLTTSVGGGTYSYAYDTWMQMKVDIDLNANWAIFSIDDTEIQSWMWSAGSEVNALGAVNFYGNAQTNPCEFYFDDFSLFKFDDLPTVENFTAELVGGNDVELDWDAPGIAGYLQWDTGENTGNAIGLLSGGTFSCASRWPAAELTPYHGMKISSISFFPKSDPYASFVLKIWRNHNEVYSQEVSSITLDEFNEVVLDQPFIINAAEELWFGYQVSHTPELYPAGCDDGPAVPEYGDLINDGTGWISMYNILGFDQNINLAALVVEDADGVETYRTMVKQAKTQDFSQGNSSQFVASKTKSETKVMNSGNSRGILGFDVYRNNEIIAQQINVTNYFDENLLPGTYNYDVKVVYDQGVSAGAGPIEVVVPGGVDRNLVLVEIGTGTWCQYCPGSAMGADDLVENGHQVGIIEYHSGDDYETPESAARLNFLGVEAFPTAWFDATLKHQGGSETQSLYSTYLPKYEERIEIPSLFEFTEAKYSNTSTPGSYILTVEAKMIEAYPNLDNLVLHAVLTESHIEESWYGMDEVNFVCRDMIPDQNGTALDFSSSSTQSFELEFTIPAEYEMGNLEMIVFIQDNTSMEILQGSFAEFLPVGIEEVLETEKIAVYPNPVTDVVNIAVDMEINSLSIYNSFGQVVATKTTQQESNTYKINTSEFTSGVYFIKIDTLEDGVITRKFVIK